MRKDPRELPAVGAGTQRTRSDPSGFCQMMNDSEPIGILNVSLHNVSPRCQLERVLPQLHEKYAADSDGGLRILAFPSNQFGRQGSIIKKK